MHLPLFDTNNLSVGLFSCFIRVSNQIMRGTSSRSSCSFDSANDFSRLQRLWHPVSLSRRRADVHGADRTAPIIADQNEWPAVVVMVSVCLLVLMVVRSALTTALFSRQRPREACTVAWEGKGTQHRSRRPGPLCLE